MENQPAAGSLTPDSGGRRFDGRDMDEWIRSDYKSLARRIGMVHQNPAESFSHRFTVFDILTEPLKIHGIVNKVIHIERVHEVLTLVHLPEDDTSSLAAQHGRAPAPEHRPRSDPQAFPAHR